MSGFALENWHDFQPIEPATPSREETGARENEGHRCQLAHAAPAKDGDAVMNGQRFGLDVTRVLLR